MTSSLEFSLPVQDLKECQNLAQRIAQAVSPPVVIELIGTLGAGKTQFTRFFVTAMGGNEDEVSSPTFVLMKKYRAKSLIYHMDLYRLQDEDELLEIGFEEVLDDNAVVLIEWADKFPDVMPLEKLRIEIAVTPDSPTSRTFKFTACGDTACSILKTIA